MRKCTSPTADGDEHSGSDLRQQSERFDRRNVGMNPVVVEVHDQYRDPMEGVTVTFAVSAGGGSLSDTTV